MKNLKTSNDKVVDVHSFVIKPCPFCGVNAVRYALAGPCKRYELVHRANCFFVLKTMKVTHIPIKNKYDGNIDGIFLESLIEIHNQWEQRAL